MSRAASIESKPIWYKYKLGLSLFFSVPAKHPPYFLIQASNSKLRNKMGIPHESIQDKFNRLTVGITQEEAIAEMGTSYTRDGNKLVWACPGHASSFITVEIEDGRVVDSSISS
ncbi:hypothetical protein GGI23_000046 [Coemansia sp. RSA 2559]|nr:hypothetical protein GGI23_000046 [Coemansia sp. RSA 2559]KAJ2869803.1 hypothetical protein GGI22_000045 [Coemansia erecta]